MGVEERLSAQIARVQQQARDGPDGRLRALEDSQRGWWNAECLGTLVHGEIVKPAKA